MALVRKAGIGPSWTTIGVAGELRLARVVLPEGEQSLDVQPQSADQNRPAVAVVARIPDALHIGTQRDPAPGVQVVVTFQDLLAAVIERSVAQEEAFAA